MPIKIPDELPAFDALVEEGVRVMTEAAAIRQDIRPLQIGLLNLMPNKIKTELQMARLLGASPLQVELSLIRLGTHKSKHTSEDHMMTFYQAWEEAKDRKFDGFIVTGTPLETIPYEEVTYWDEMQRIFEWTRTNVHSTMYVCWGAMAALYHFHGVPKRLLPEKAFGVYPAEDPEADIRPISAASPTISRFRSRAGRRSRSPILKAIAELSLLAFARRAPRRSRKPRRQRLYVLDHLEYDATSLADEYFRDVKANIPIKLPRQLFPRRRPRAAPPNTWRAHGHLLLSNWINEMYQTTPFDSGILIGAP